MASDSSGSSCNGPTVLDSWSARKVRPIVVFYVVVVFAVFIALSQFVFQSPEAVKALVIAAVGAVIATIPSVTGMIEYQATESGIEKRAFNAKTPGEFEDVFEWAQLSHVALMRHGFKYSKAMNETNPLRRFWKAHFSDRFSGEIHVEKKDLERILAIIERQRGQIL